VRERLDGLHDEPRPGAPRQISDEQIERVIVRTLEETPLGETHWSSRGMAKATGLGRNRRAHEQTIRRGVHRSGAQLKTARQSSILPSIQCPSCMCSSTVQPGPVTSDCHQ
jgi:transposase